MHAGIDTLTAADAAIAVVKFDVTRSMVELNCLTGAGFDAYSTVFTIIFHEYYAHGVTPLHVTRTFHNSYCSAVIIRYDCDVP